MKGDRDMPTLRLIPADELPADEPLRFPIEAVRTINAARSASANASPSQPQAQRGSTQDVMDALCDLTRRTNDLTRDLDVLGHLGGDGNDDDDRPRAA